MGTGKNRLVLCVDFYIHIIEIWDKMLIGLTKLIGKQNKNKVW